MRGRIGGRDLGVATVQSDGLSFGALWLAGSGLAILLIGVLTLLARSALGGSSRPVRSRARLRDS